MDKEKLLHAADVELNGEMFEIKVYASPAGRYFARTCLGHEDFIITDGPSVPEALEKHQSLLPLAVSTREMNQSYRGFVRRSRSRR